MPERGEKMSRTPQTKGPCVYCGKLMTSGGMAKHLGTCPQRLVQLDTSDGKAGTVQRLYHLLVRDRYSKQFWLHLEMNGSAKLKDLDVYLRAIWLECCGHMSKFTAKGWGTADIPSSWTAQRAFDVHPELIHLYDFGTTSETVIRVVGSREGKPLTRHPIVLMARNDMPEATCMECDARATHFCQECTIERDETGLLCAKCVEDHPCHNYGEPIPLVNSPRLGMCGYDGPATPPY